MTTQPTSSFNVLVTGIGGNVGQGIIRNIHSSPFKNIKIIGTNIAEFSPGNHLCDRFYCVPYATDPGYLPCLLQIIKEEKIDLIIPSTDFESLALSKNAQNLPCKIATSSALSTKIYGDKYLSALHHEEHAIPFAKTYLPSSYDQQFRRCIVKPRAGRGSRDLFIDPKDFCIFKDEDFIVQEYLEGEEITTAFYIDKASQLHGMITFSRKLDNGATSECIVTHRYNEQVESILRKMNQSLDLKGSLNLQSIVSNGKVIPFEINCRVSGTNSIRSQFGFKDVEYVLEEYLFNKKPTKPQITQGEPT